MSKWRGIFPSATFCVLNVGGTVGVLSPCFPPPRLPARSPVAVAHVYVARCQQKCLRKGKPVLHRELTALWKMRRQSLIQWNFFRTFSRELNILNVLRGKTCAGESRTMTHFTALPLAKHSSAPCARGEWTGLDGRWSEARESFPPASSVVTQNGQNRGQVCSQIPCAGGGRGISHGSLTGSEGLEKGKSVAL